MVDFVGARKHFKRNNLHKPNSDRISASSERYDDYLTRDFSEYNLGSRRIKLII